MGEIEVRGPEALKLVDFVATNAAANLKIGQAQYSALLYEHGGFVDDILVHKVADNHYFLCVNASNQDKDYEHIAAHNPFDARVENAAVWTRNPLDYHAVGGRSGLDGEARQGRIRRARGTRQTKRTGNYEESDWI